MTKTIEPLVSKTIKPLVSKKYFPPGQSGPQNPSSSQPNTPNGSNAAKKRRDMDKINSSLLQQCEDERIPRDQERASSLIDWVQFVKDLSSIGDINAQRKALELKFERKVTAYKDGSNFKTFHREHIIEDSLLQQALRRSPPGHVLENFSQISPTYKVSRMMHDLINNISFNDEDWTDVKRVYYNMRKSEEAGGYNLNEEEIRTVLCLRHGWREDTILMISSRRRPPVRFVRLLLKQCPEIISIVDTPLYDWIPLIYAIAYNASPEVQEALIPSSKYQGKFNFLTTLDVYDRTPLHWTVFYGASVESVRSIAKASGDNAFNCRDGDQNRAFELAITEGACMEVVKALIPSSVDFDTVERNIVRSCIWAKTSTSDSTDLEEEEADDLKMYDVSGRNHTYLAKSIARKEGLQQILRQKSCSTTATVTMMLDFYSCILLLYSFRSSTTYYLELSQEEKNKYTPPVHLYVLIITLSYMLVRELGQMYINGVYWFTSIWNYFDIVTVACGLTVVLMMLHNDTADNFGGLVVATTALVWINALFFLRSTFLQFSIFISGLNKIVSDLAPFLGVTFLLLIAFGEMYMADNLANGRCNIEDGVETKFCSFGESLLSTFDFFLGGISLSENSDSGIMTVISIVYGFLVTIVLLNVVIAIVSDSWAIVHEQGKNVFWQYRLIFLTEVKSYEEYLCISAEPSWIDGLMKICDTCLDKVCNFFWVREYWGSFDSIIDRVTTEEYGGLSWQFTYDYKRAGWCKKAHMIIKTIILLAIFWFFVLLWFLWGLASVGLFWPTSIRRAIFGQMVIEEKTELEEISEEIQKVAEISRLSVMKE